jgi:hypothetical protein
MGLGEGTTSWDRAGKGPAPNGMDGASVHQTQDGTEAARGRAGSDWGPLFAFTAVMAVPFALVAWLMS